MKKLNRKEFLSKGTLALAGSSLLLNAACSGSESENSQSSISSNPQKTYKWKMVTTWPPNFPILGDGCKLMAQWVEKMSGGRLKIQVYGGGELVPALEAFDAVSSGAAEMANGGAYYWAGKVPAAQFFATVPFGMNAQQVNGWILCGGGQELWDEVYAPFNLQGFPAGNTGVQMGGWFNKPINSLADLKGLKMRIPGLGGKVMSKAGATVINVAGGEIYTNLERGVIDATEWLGPFHDYTMGFHKIAKYYYYPGWHEPGTVLETLVNKSKLAALPEDLQEILVTAIMRQNTWTLAQFESRNSEFLAKIMEEEGLELRVFPDEVLAKLRELTQESINELVNSNPMARKIYDSYSAYKQKAQAWSELTEKIYYEKIQ